MVIIFLMIASETVHWVKVLTVEPEILSLILRTHIDEKRELTLTSCPTIPIGISTLVWPLTNGKNFAIKLKKQNGDFSYDNQKL